MSANPLVEMVDRYTAASRVIADMFAGLDAIGAYVDQVVEAGAAAEWLDVHVYAQAGVYEAQKYLEGV